MNIVLANRNELPFINECIVRIEAYVAFVEGHFVCAVVVVDTFVISFIRALALPCIEEGFHHKCERSVRCTKLNSVYSDDLPCYSPIFLFFFFFFCLFSLLHFACFSFALIVHVCLLVCCAHLPYVTTLQ